MIRENQKILNFINVISDGLILLLALPIAFWLRFYVLPGGIIHVYVNGRAVLEDGNYLGGTNGEVVLKER